jgi:hypothetical protein
MSFIRTLVVLLSVFVLVPISASAQAEAGACEDPREGSAIPAGWDFQINGLSSPAEVLAGSTIEVRYCVPPYREGIDRDHLSTVRVGDPGSDAIHFKRRKKNSGICSYGADGEVATGGHQEATFYVGKEPGLIEVRFYTSVIKVDKGGKAKSMTSFDDSSLVWFGESICVEGAGDSGTAASAGAATGSGVGASVPALSSIGLGLLGVVMIGAVYLKRQRHNG